MGRAFHSGRKLFSAWSKLPLWKMYQKKFWNSVVRIDIGTFRKFWFSWSKLKNSWKWWLHRKFHIKSLTVVNRRLIVLRVEKIFMNFIIWSIGVIIWFTIPKGIEYPPWYVRQTISFELDEKMKLKTKTEMERAEPQVELSYGLKEKMDFALWIEGKNGWDTSKRSKWLTQIMTWKWLNTRFQQFQFKCTQFGREWKRHDFNFETQPIMSLFRSNRPFQLWLKQHDRCENS